jgi:hypothetical protein
VVLPEASHCPGGSPAARPRNLETAWRGPIATAGAGRRDGER